MASIQISSLHKDNILELTLTGAYNREAALEVWQYLSTGMKAHTCEKALVISRVELVLTRTESADHPEIFKETGIRSHYKIAWVVTNQNNFGHANFVETVLQNRGYFCARVFRDEESARQWLSE